MSEAEYVDYITEKQGRFRLIEESVFLLAKEHQNILNALAERNMTVKEIHELYLLPKGKHSKTLKTIYRYLDMLEQLDLIKVAGHRKYQGARSLEKLYCRTAKVFFNDDVSRKEKWLTSEEGIMFIDTLTEILWMNHDRKGDKTQLRNLVVEYFRKQQTQSHNMIEKITNDDEYADTLDKLSFYYIKSIVDIMPQIQTMLDNKELIEKIRKALD